jgi:hypothetical protein
MWGTNSKIEFTRIVKGIDVSSDWKPGTRTENLRNEDGKDMYAG